MCGRVGGGCQLKYFASTPRQKEMRAAYMRDYRIKEKDRTERSHRLALASKQLANAKVADAKKPPLKQP